MGALFLIIILYLIGAFYGVIGFDEERDSRAEEKRKNYFRKFNAIMILIVFLIIAGYS